MYLSIYIFLLLPFVLLAEEAPYAEEEPHHEHVITKTYTLTSTTTYTTTMSMITSAMIVPHINQTMPTGQYLTASISAPAPASASAPSPSNIYKGNGPYVGGPPASPNASAPIMSGDGGEYLSANKVLLVVAGLAAILATS